MLLSFISHLVYTVHAVIYRRSQTELGSKELTSVTLRMAECESEMEEHELKIELLQRQLQLARDGRNRCRQQRAELQAKVQSVV